MRIVIGSVSKNAGKTSMIIGMAKAIGGEKSLGYMKPMGDRMLYRKKRQWDYDHALFHGIFGLDENLEDITLGFDHTKLRYMYDKDGLKKKLNETAGNVEKDLDVLFVEGGEDLIYGASVNLDVMSVSRYIDAELVLVVGGQDDKILDDLFFIQKDLDLNKVKLKGVIINKVKDVEEFKSTNMEMVEKTGLKILGIVPHMAALDYVTVRYLAEQLFAKVVAGEENLDREIRHIFVGAMSADAALRQPNFKEEGKLIITSGDRSDMILAALDSKTACIVLTNNVLPPGNILAEAQEKGVPILSVPFNTFETSKKIDDMETMITKEETAKIALLEKIVKDNIDLQAIF